VKLAACIKIHAANCAFSTTKSTACMYAATYTRLTVRHVYSDCTRGELQVAKSSVFCSERIIFCLKEDTRGERQFLSCMFIF